MAILFVQTPEQQGGSISGSCSMHAAWAQHHGLCSAIHAACCFHLSTMWLIFEEEEACKCKQQHYLQKQGNFELQAG
jgi:hypothetical protein